MYALPEVMYDKEHILIGREVTIRKQSEWSGYSWLLNLIYSLRATFKLTRDSQGAARSVIELEDFRTRFREKRDL